MSNRIEDILYSKILEKIMYESGSDYHKINNYLTTMKSHNLSTTELNKILRLLLLYTYKATSDEIKNKQELHKINKALEEINNKIKYILNEKEPNILKEIKSIH